MKNNKITITLINNFLTEKTPPKKIELKHIIENIDKNIYYIIMRGDILHLNNKLYYYNFDTKKYIFYAFEN